MLFHFVLFPFFLLAIASLGAFFLNLLSIVMQIPKEIEFDLSIHGVFGLFFLGMAGIIFNFFLPLASTVFHSVIGSCIIFGCIIFIKNKSRIPSKDTLCIILISLILAPIAGSINPQYDAGLYHLPHQLWLRSEPIIVGFANLHGRFGFGSLYEYISAPLWINDQFTILSYLQVSYVVYFMFFLIKQASISRGTHLILLSGVAVNLALFSDYLDFGYNHSGYTYTDLPAGLLFTSAFIYGHWFLFREKSVNKGDWAIFSILLLSAVFYKVSAGILIFWMIFVILYRVFFNNDSISECILGLTVPVGFLLIFLMKNFITTGCILYPVPLSCFDVPWAATKNAINDANWITAWARHPHSGLSSLQDNSWFLTWWVPKYQPFLIKLFSSGLFVGILYGGISLNNKFRSLKILDMRLWASAAFLMLAFLFWFWNAPTPRFGIGTFILLFPVLFLYLNGNALEKKDNYLKLFRVITVIAVLIVVFRIGVPWKRISLENALTFTTLKVGEPKTQIDSVYGVRPVEGDQCWLVPECAPGDRPPKSTWYRRSAFFSK